jgi:hypothetical protein
MSWEIVEAGLAFLALVIIPRFILEVAWSRRARAKIRASGTGPISLGDRLRAQSWPWIVFGAVGIACALGALVALLIAR